MTWTNEDIDWAVKWDNGRLSRYRAAKFLQWYWEGVDNDKLYEVFIAAYQEHLVVEARKAVEGALLEWCDNPKREVHEDDGEAD